MRSFTEFTAEKQLSENAIMARAREIFLQLEAVIMRGQGTRPDVGADINPQEGDVFISKTGNNPQLYVIVKGSLFDGLRLTSVTKYYDEWLPILQDSDKNRTPIPMKFLEKLITKKLEPNELIRTTKKFDYNLLTDWEKAKLAASNVNPQTLIWTNDAEIIGKRQKDANTEERKRAIEAQAEEKRLHGLGVVTHKTPTVRAAQEDFMRKKFSGDAAAEPPKETPEEMQRRVFGASEPTPSPTNEPDAIRQRMNMQNMRDYLAQRQAKRDAGEVIPPSNRLPFRRR